MKNFLAVCLLALAGLLCFVEPAQAQQQQPCQWNYSLVNNQAVATYCGVVNSSGGITISAVTSITALEAIQAPFSGQAAIVDGTQGGTFIASNSACNNAGAGDGGTQFPSYNGGCWIRQITGGIYNVRWFGALGNGTTDDTTAEQKAITATPSGGTVFWPASNSYYKTSNSLTISKPITLAGTGIVKMSVGSEPLFKATNVSNITIDGLSLEGFQSASFSDNENAIDIEGELNPGIAPTYISNIVIKNTVINGFGETGIYLAYVKNFAVTNNTIENMVYAGSIVSSCDDGIFNANTVNNVTGVGAAENNAYGLAITRATGDSGNLTSQPNSTNIVVAANNISNIPTWEGLDTHSGQNITFTGNQISNVRLGINVGTSVNYSGTDTYSPNNVVVMGNTINSGVSDGSTYAGINFQGSATNIATGSITGNSIYQYGNQNYNTIAAIDTYSTNGLIISSNLIYEPAVVGIFSNGADNGLVISNNTIVDPWSNNSSQPEVQCVLSVGTEISEIISGNYCKRGNLSATYLITSPSGIAFNTTATSSSISLGLNISDATTYAIGNTEIVAPNMPKAPTSCTKQLSGSLYNNSGVAAFCP